MEPSPARRAARIWRRPAGRPRAWSRASRFCPVTWRTGPWQALASRLPRAGLTRSASRRPLADSIRAAHQEGAFGAGDLPLVLPGHLAEGGRLRGDEVHLGAAPMRKTGEGGQVDAGLVELAERPRALPRPVRAPHLEVGNLLDVRHGHLLLATSRS